MTVVGRNVDENLICESFDSRPQERILQRENNQWWLYFTTTKGRKMLRNWISDPENKLKFKGDLMFGASEKVQTEESLSDSNYKVISY